MNKENTKFDVVIIGGSYAGLSAAMALGRALRNVLVIDSGKPCNAQTPHSHNFITQDGETPAAIAAKAKEQVMQYPSVQFLNDIAVAVSGENSNFSVSTSAGLNIHAKKILFATGVKDIMPAIEGFAACWGISVIHCPYCYGYEYKSQPTGILMNGDMAIDMAELI
ncbi:MAG: NAD(P)/FAD-dependent oxidoreductase, partial [Pedobacter sp.]|nr:NAD(P)/FAD-dependent oxidoreductase [Pedobacter sp.]